MSNVRPILLAEDNPNDIELVVAALHDAHLVNEILIARDGEEALDCLYRRGRFAGRTSAQPAVILLDLKMPKVDGLEALQRIRADTDLRTIPVVILTSSREESDLLRTYELGINAYVVKPVDFSEFTGAVTKLGCFWALLNEPPPEKVAKS